MAFVKSGSSFETHVRLPLTNISPIYRFACRLIPSVAASFTIVTRPVPVTPAKPARIPYFFAYQLRSFQIFLVLGTH